MRKLSWFENLTLVGIILHTILTIITVGIWLGVVSVLPFIKTYHCKKCNKEIDKENIRIGISKELNINGKTVTVSGSTKVVSDDFGNISASDEIELTKSNCKKK